MKFYFFGRQTERTFHEMKLKCSMGCQFPLLCSTKFDISPAGSLSSFFKRRTKIREETSFSPTLSFGCASSPESAIKENEECKSILSGTTSPLRGSCHCFAMERIDSTGTKYTPCGVCALSGATSSLRSSCRLRRGEPTAPAQNTLLAECVHFQGLLRRCAPRAAFGGANRHPRTTVRSILFYRSDVVLPLKTQSKKMRNAEAFLIFLVHQCNSYPNCRPWLSL